MYLKNIRAKELSKHNTQTASGTHRLNCCIVILYVFQSPSANCFLRNKALLFSFSEEKRSKKGTFPEVLGISTSSEVDEGLCPLNPCQLLKKLDQNFCTWGSLGHTPAE